MAGIYCLYVALVVYAPIMLHWNANKFVLRRYNYAPPCTHGHGCMDRRGETTCRLGGLRKKFSGSLCTFQHTCDIILSCTHSIHFTTIFGLSLMYYVLHLTQFGGQRPPQYLLEGGGGDCPLCPPPAPLPLMQSWSVGHTRADQSEHLTAMLLPVLDIKYDTDCVSSVV